jgi:hypothetical protein
MEKEKLENYIVKARAIHNNLYDYTKTKPHTCKDKCIVTCNIHGDFITTLDNHINGKTGCPKCKKVAKLTTDEFVEKAKQVHGDKYDYSKTEYINMRTKICIICSEHGEFWQEPRHHLNGIRCPKCAGTKKLNNKEFIEKAKEIHGDKYDYSKVRYINNKTPICIICAKHGEFWQTPSSHINAKTGCPKCAKNGVLLTTEEFIEKAKEIHGDYYSYDKVNYINAHEKICIICPRHGEFWQEASSHLQGKSCPKCKSSKLENIVLTYLNNNKINYIFQHKLKNLGKKTLDFYLPDYNIAIECQGEQHYIPTSFGSMTNDESNEVFEKRKELDLLKSNECKKENIELIYFTIPNYFHNKNINIYTEFYQDKKVFTDIKSLIDYLNHQKQNIKTNSFNEFYADILSINTNITCKNNAILYKNYALQFNYCIPNDRDTLNSINRYNKKQLFNTINIFEDEYVYNKEIVLNKIKHLVENHNTLSKIAGRKCKINEINMSNAKLFLDKFHIQGFAASTIYLGAYYDNKLIAVMTFLNEGKGRWNLTRFASDYNYICQGVGGKLFKYFIRNYNPNEVKSFADRRWTINEENNVYIQLGFKFDKYLAPEYRYYNPKVDKYKRFHKFAFRKQILHKRFNLPLSMSETEMTKTLGYDRIWDCGLIKYIWKKETNG